MVVASGAVFKGLAQELGLDFRLAADSDDPGGDLRSRIHLALEDRGHDFIHIHTKAADEAAHSGDPLQKTSVIGGLDDGLEELVQRAAEDDDLLVAVVSDHSTPSVSSLIHSGEPVPVTVAGPGVRRDAVSRFDEIHGAGGCLGFLRGEELLRILLNYADRSVLEGHRLGPRVRAYYPSVYDPFRLTE
jgi:2,3-bisphosphoglycerate-independent phosphoglycerate mutase